jgi:hypothetical protein
VKVKAFVESLTPEIQPQGLQTDHLLSTYLLSCFLSLVLTHLLPECSTIPEQRSLRGNPKESLTVKTLAQK